MSDERPGDVPERPPDAPTVVTGGLADWPTGQLSMLGDEREDHGSRPDGPGWAFGSPPAPPPAPAAARTGRLDPPATGRLGWRGAGYSTAAAGSGRAAEAAATRPGPRRARLTLRRVDPWSVLKVTFVYSLAGFLIFLVAVSLLYGVLSAMGVFHSVDSFLSTVGANGKVSSYLGYGRVFDYTAVIGLINVVLFSALATLGAFVYNVCGELVGGLELTLTESK